MFRAHFNVYPSRSIVQPLLLYHSIELILLPDCRKIRLKVSKNYPFHLWIYCGVVNQHQTTNTTPLLNAQKTFDRWHHFLFIIHIGALVNSTWPLVIVGCYYDFLCHENVTEHLNENDLVWHIRWLFMALWNINGVHHVLCIFVGKCSHWAAQTAQSFHLWWWWTLFFALVHIKSQNIASS